MSEHEEELEIVALYALGCLGPEEATEVQAHVRSCARCSEEYRTLQEAGALIGASSDDEALRFVSRLERTKRKLLEAVTASPKRRPVPSIVAATHARRQPWYETPWFARSLAAAAIAYALVVGVSVRMHREVAAVRPAAPPAPVLDARLVAALADVSARRYAVTGGAVVRHADRVYFVLDHVPPISPGHVFQAWTLAKGAHVMTPGATAPADARGQLVIELPQAASSLVAVGLTVEPVGGSKQPTTKPLFVQMLGKA